MRRIALVLAAVMVAATSLMGGVLPARAEVNPYITEGTHTVNNRQWRTTCEPYSQTKRCRAEIWSTQVSQVNGKFVAKNQWAFNNLTYLESPRTLWANNPLGYTTKWTANDGRRWYTECDTPATGRNGCRSYAESDVIAATQKNGVWTYRWVTKYVFNNIVNFNVPRPPAEAVVVMPDKNLKECINLQMGNTRGSEITLEAAAEVVEVSCAVRGITNLQGLQSFTNLEFLNLYENQISNLQPLQGLKNLIVLDLSGNVISDLKPLASVTIRNSLNLTYNRISDVSPLKSHTTLDTLRLSYNEIKDLTPLGPLKDLNYLDVSGNKLTHLNGVSALTGLYFLDVGFNEITDVSQIAPLTGLGVLSVRYNQISDVAPLGGLKELVQLGASFNTITDVSALSSLTELEMLSLQSNKIAKVAPLATLPNLFNLDLWGNPIQDQASLDPLIARGCQVLFNDPDRP